MRVLFNKHDGRVVGILYDKLEFKEFKRQRYIEDYHVVKMDESELDDAFEYKDISNYTPIYYDEIIVFADEDVCCTEIILANLDASYHYLYHAMRNIYKSIKFTKEEKIIVNVALGTVAAVYGQLYNNELDIEREMNYRKLLIEQMKAFGLRRDYT